MVRFTRFQSDLGRLIFGRVIESAVVGHGDFSRRTVSQGVEL